MQEILKRILFPFSLFSDLQAAAQSHQIRIQKLEFPESFLKNVFCFQVKGHTPDGQTVYGLGTDLNRNKALLKAYVEFLERSAFFTLGKKFGFESTNGIAGHRFEYLAERAAVAEINERDSFLFHWYLGIPMKQKRSPYRLNDIIQSMKKVGYRTFFLQTFLGSSQTTSCFLINESSGGFVVGLSAGKGWAQDCEKSMTEALVNLFFGDYGRSEQSLLELKSEGFRKLEHHRTFWTEVATFPDWLLAPVKQEDYGQFKKPRPVEKVFSKTIGHVTVVGYRGEDSLPIIIGAPKAKELQILKTRSPHQWHSLISTALMRPHPIP
jgi:hypothetical protein